GSSGIAASVPPVRPSKATPKKSRRASESSFSCANMKFPRSVVKKGMLGDNLPNDPCLLLTGEDFVAWRHRARLHFLWRNAGCAGGAGPWKERHADTQARNGQSARSAEHGNRSDGEFSTNW